MCFEAGVRGRVLSSPRQISTPGKQAPVRQNGSTVHGSSGASGVVLRFPDGDVGIRTTGPAERSHEAAGTPGDERDRMHRGGVRALRPVRGDAPDPERIR